MLSYFPILIVLKLNIVRIVIDRIVANICTEFTVSFFFFIDLTESDVYYKLLDNSSHTYYKEIRPQSSNGRRQLSVKFDINIQNIHSLVGMFIIFKS